MIRIEGSIPVDLPIKNGKRFLFISKDQRAYTHGIHKYPAKFFPELPRWIIERYSRPGDMVLDPFMGSGTTNLEASLLGRNSIGIDVDPLSRLIARVKTTPLPEKDLSDAYSRLENKAKNYHENKIVDGVPDFPYRDNWFKPYILRELAYLLSQIESLPASKDIKDFFKVSLSSIIRQVSEADNNCTRTVIRKKLGKEVNPLDAINLFIKRTQQNIKGMLALASAKPSGEIDITGGGARRL